MNLHLLPQTTRINYKARENEMVSNVFKIVGLDNGPILGLVLTSVSESDIDEWSVEYAPPFQNQRFSMNFGIVIRFSGLVSNNFMSSRTNSDENHLEENRVLRINGESKEEEQVEGEKWHRVERINGKFWRRFTLPLNADLDHVKAHLEDGVLKFTMPKFSDEAKRQSKVIDIDSSGGSGEDVKKTTKTSSQ